MRLIETVAELKHQVQAAHDRDERVGFVPTMGALHEGHLALIRRARAQCNFVVVSAYVNPTQFGAGEDFRRYPRTPEMDIEVCRSGGADLLWIPSDKEMYDADEMTRVTVGRMGQRLCGAARPGHFDGVATIIVKLLMAARPDVIYMGEKDFQQSVLVKRVVDDLLIPVEVRTVPTVREPDGLALSSRNSYLTEKERISAGVIAESLEEATKLVAEGETSIGRILARVEVVLAGDSLLQPEYAEIVDPDSLEPADVFDRPLRLLVAAHLGSTRLIDNVELVPVSKDQVSLSDNEMPQLAKGESAR